MIHSNIESVEINSDATSSSTSNSTINSSFSSAAERGKKILMFLKSSRMKNYDISSVVEDDETSISSEIDQIDGMWPVTPPKQHQNRRNEISTEQTCSPQRGVVKEKTYESDKLQYFIREDMNEMMAENYRTQAEIQSVRERNASLNKKLEQLSDKLRDQKLEKKTYLQRIELLNQEVTYLKNELQEYHYHSKSANEREYELQSQLRSLQRKQEQIFKDYIKLKETAAALKQKVEAKENVIVQLKESGKKRLELEETWRLERDSLIRAYENSLLKNEQLEKMNEKLRSQSESDKEQFAVVERSLRQRLEELERNVEEKELEIENWRKECDCSWNELQQLRRELTLKTESIRNYETQLICSEEALKFSKDSASQLQQQLQDLFHKREQLENRLEERERQNNAIYSENADLKKTVKEYQDKLSEQHKELELYKTKLSELQSSLTPARIDSVHQTDATREFYENEQEALFSRMQSLFLDAFHQLQFSNEEYFRNPNKRGRPVWMNENIATSQSHGKDLHSGSVNFSFERRQVSDFPNYTQFRASEKDFDNTLNEKSNVEFHVNERRDIPKDPMSKIYEWKLKLMEWKFLLDVNMKKEFLFLVKDHDIVARVEKISQELFLLLSLLERFQGGCYEEASKQFPELSLHSKATLNSDQENVVLGAILVHIHQLRNLWLHEVQVNHVLRNILLSGNATSSHFSPTYPESSKGYSYLVESCCLERETME
ncbi:hypothetical protein GAYE_SCF19G4012 [Galdieria yellowstonensis]|uniref:Uncharacterized protein n=1 Tax=Galdieria yellowstonensis TaxID=3028027 RepID=A0AAV9IFG2_9RHOD|nr:hypothetical protein GAYE_SCF19G4012 [Galdieria yellowstonensis]